MLTHLSLAGDNGNQLHWRSPRVSQKAHIHHGRHLHTKYVRPKHSVDCCLVCISTFVIFSFSRSWIVLSAHPARKQRNHAGPREAGLTFEAEELFTDGEVEVGSDAEDGDVDVQMGLPPASEGSANGVQEAKVLEELGMDVDVADVQESSTPAKPAKRASPTKPAAPKSHSTTPTHPHVEVQTHTQVQTPHPSPNRHTQTR